MGTFHCKYSTRQLIQKLFGVELGQRCWHGGVGLSHIIDVGTRYYWILVNRGFYWLCWLLDYQYFVADVGFTLFSWNRCSSHKPTWTINYICAVIIRTNYSGCSWKVVLIVVQELFEIGGCRGGWRLQRWSTVAEMFLPGKDVRVYKRKQIQRFVFNVCVYMNSMFIIFLTVNTILSSNIVINMSFGFY